jgi:hypothetical protein
MFNWLNQFLKMFKSQTELNQSPVSVMTIGAFSAVIVVVSYIRVIHVPQM